jgi:hypothetical protein
MPGTSAIFFFFFSNHSLSFLLSDFPFFFFLSVLMNCHLPTVEPNNCLCPRCTVNVTTSSPIMEEGWSGYNYQGLNYFQIVLDEGTDAICVSTVDLVLTYWIRNTFFSFCNCFELSLNSIFFSQNFPTSSLFSRMKDQLKETLRSTSMEQALAMHWIIFVSLAKGPLQFQLLTRPILSDAHRHQEMEHIFCWFNLVAASSILL